MVNEKANCETRSFIIFVYDLVIHYGYSLFDVAKRFDELCGVEKKEISDAR